MHKLFKKITSRISVMGSGLAHRRDSPDELLGELFQDVQLKRVYPDGQIFVDLAPAKRLDHILKAYKMQRHNPQFDLHKFVQLYFKEYIKAPNAYKTNPKHTLEQHISELWDVLSRENYKRRGSLLPLPRPYIVPGGRFGAMYYWDTYFTMLGLAVDGRYDLVEGMLKNCAYLVRKYGRIPNANRTYFLGRSHPPFFSHMVRLMAQRDGKSVFVVYLPYLLAEYRFWMKGQKQLTTERPSIRRVVLMPNGEVLNRYYDDKSTPRPESYKEDVDTALLATDRIPSKVYVDLRAGAESGWDFSSRWCKNPMLLQTTNTTDIVPVDLNCLLVQLEQTIAQAYRVLRQNKLASRYTRLAERRIAAINKYCWNEKKNFYFDYDFALGQQSLYFTLAGMFPLYAHIATKQQAEAVAQVIRTDFLKAGGVVTTLATTGQQWDAPNGWAPLQWVTVRGLRYYGQDTLADDIKKRWIQLVTKIYQEQGKMVEKYNVVDPGMSAGGGEYALQDGFGWTNGVTLALLHEDAIH